MGKSSTQKMSREYVVFPANHLANVLTNKTKRHRKNATQYNSINLNTINTG